MSRDPFDGDVYRRDGRAGNLSGVSSKGEFHRHSQVLVLADPYSSRLCQVRERNALLRSLNDDDDDDDDSFFFNSISMSSFMENGVSWVP